MSYNIIIEPSAQNDIEDAYIYYKTNVNQKTANLFLKMWRESLRSLQINPFYQIRIKNYRALLIEKFPFLIFFQVFEDLKLVKIIAVFNTKQEPSKYPN